MLLLLLLTDIAGATDEVLFEAIDGQELSLTRYSADGDYLLLWLAPEYGFREAHRSLAKRVSAEGIEVWQGDLVESLFMPPGTASIKQLDGAYAAELIVHAHRETGKQIAIAGDSYAAVTALRGAHRWQQKLISERYLVGAVLFSPNSYAFAPPLGTAPEYLPIVKSTNIPLMIFQAENSAVLGQFETLLQELRRNASPVYTRMVPDVMSLFYQQPPTDAMVRGALPLASNIRQALTLLAQHDYPLKPVTVAEAVPADRGVDIYLKEFRGNQQPEPIILDDITGKRFTRTDFSGRVTLVNFWATWCPPCIEEIPSLNRLKVKMNGRPFELVSINYAQERQTVLDFMQRVEVDFPVLVDVNGEHAKAWNVITYPSTFVIDQTGNIRYGVNAAIDWDSPQLLEKLEALMR